MTVLAPIKTDRPGTDLPIWCASCRQHRPRAGSVDSVSADGLRRERHCAACISAAAARELKRSGPSLSELFTANGLAAEKDAQRAENMRVFLKTQEWCQGTNAQRVTRFRTKVLTALSDRSILLKDLSDATGLSHTACYKRVKDIVANGWAVYGSRAGDKSRLISITPKGRKALKDGKL